MQIYHEPFAVWELQRMNLRQPPLVYAFFENYLSGKYKLIGDGLTVKY